MSLLDVQHRLRPVAQPLPAAMDSPCLSLLYSTLSATSGKAKVLSLGALSQSLLDYFQQFECEIWILDMFQELRDYEQARESAGDDSGIFGTTPTFPSFLQGSVTTSPCNLVLLWDYINYLKAGTVMLLLDHICRMCRAGALLYFFTTPRGDMSTSPGEFHLLTNERLHYAPVGENTMQSPAYTPTQLLDLMPSFSILKLSLLGNGLFQENLFRFENYKNPQGLRYRADVS